MKISTDQVQNMARLARLHLEPEQLDPLANQFGEILNYMEVLNGVDTTGIEPLYSPFESITPTRIDEVHTHCTREDLLSNAPQTDGSFFVVPRIV